MFLRYVQTHFIRKLDFFKYFFRIFLLCNICKHFLSKGLS